MSPLNIPTKVIFPSEMAISKKLVPHEVNYILCSRKDRVYTTKVVLCESDVSVVSAYCTCIAGLSGYCNYVTVILYYLEGYYNARLHEDGMIGCTDQLQTCRKAKC